MSSTNSNVQRAYALIDGDNFYVSCERVFNAASRRRPVVVLSNNDGCVISRSREAKALGIPMRAPLHQVRHLLERNRVLVFSANFELYGDLSDRMIETLETFTDQVEVYSIDEAFVYLEESLASLARLAHEMRGSVYRWTGLPVTVGVGPTKTLAKVAAEYGKRDASGTRLLMTPDEIEDALRRLPVGDVWGVGHRLVERFRGWVGNPDGVGLGADAGPKVYNTAECDGATYPGGAAGCPLFWAGGYP